LVGPPADRRQDLFTALGTIDGAGERLFGPLRGRPAVDAVAGAASNMADYGVIWVALAALKARRRGPGRVRAVRALALAGISSYGLNRFVKSLVGRERPADPPTATGTPAAVPVRAPTSTSFPSGHTLAAFCSAVAIPQTSAGVGVGMAFAAVVAASRVHLRAHHLSDVAAGAVLGATLGAAVRRALRAME